MSTNAATLPEPHLANPRQRETRTITVVSIAHGCSHFFHLIVAPLFPWLKVEFDLS
jgi:hypothetical protein